MPLGIFGGGSSNGPKPQPLTSEKKEKREKGSGSGFGLLDIKDSKGTTIKLGKKNYTVEKKLAEGGFALVYLVCDKHNRNYALKRQLIRDDPRQIEACKTECQIVKNLNGHKNIVAYVNHQLSVNKVGIYDYMLLTVYYPTNVLQLMNSRLLSNRWLSQTEILDIFCDICEAVARLHHSKTPVIHRDLKVENVLIDQRTGNEKPVYILCDFGSATTKVLSKETHSQAYMEEEVRRYTTLSYRAPEMIDLFSGIPISTKSDIWALGVLLYKICYFALPFGESALAIQNGSFSFPDQPDVCKEIKAIINLLLTSSARHRPNIFQTSYLAFAATNRKCPIYNIERSPRIELTEAVEILRLRDKLGANYSRLFEKAFNEFESAKKCQSLQKTPVDSSNSSDAAVRAEMSRSSDNVVLCIKTKGADEQLQQNSSSSISFLNCGNGKSDAFESPLIEGVIVNTSSAGAARTLHQTTTSVNPRLRPKATNASNILTSPFGVAPPMSARISSTSTPTPMATSTITTDSHPTGTFVEDRPIVSTNATVSQSSKVLPMDGNVTDMPAEFSLDNAMQRKCEDIALTTATSDASVTVSHSNSSDNNSNSKSNAVAVTAESNFSNQEVSSSLKSSAFKPYSMIAGKQRQRRASRTTPTAADKVGFRPNISQMYDSPDGENVAAIPFESSNPFISASASGGFTFVSGSPPTMDDNVFGERFDELRRVNRRNTIEATTNLDPSASPSRLFEISNGYSASNTVLNPYNPPLSALDVDKLRSATNNETASSTLHTTTQVQPIQLQQDALLLAQKQRFVPYSSAPPKPLDIEWLEKAINEDPFGRAPPILSHQIFNKINN